MIGVVILTDDDQQQEKEPKEERSSTSWLRTSNERMDVLHPSAIIITAI